MCTSSDYPQPRPLVQLVSHQGLATNFELICRCNDRAALATVSGPTVHSPVVRIHAVCDVTGSKMRCVCCPEHSRVHALWSSCEMLRSTEIHHSATQSATPPLNQPLNQPLTQPLIQPISAHSTLRPPQMRNAINERGSNRTSKNVTDIKSLRLCILSKCLQLASAPGNS